MKSIYSSAISIMAVALVACSQLAQAQATRTWVSGVGDDVNPCSRTAPCKTFAGAISKTAAGGEISALDPAGFGSVTITKSMTINGDGTLAGILNSGVSAVIINAGVGDTVRLRSVSLSGGSLVSPGTYGVRVLQAGQVTIENSTIEGNATAGVEVNTTAATNVVLRNVQIRGGAASSGVSVQTTAGLASVVLDGVHIQGQGTGSTSVGVAAGANAVIDINRSNINFNSTGIAFSAASALVRLSDSTISMNGIGIGAPTTSAGVSSQLISYNNNRLRGNTTDGAPTSTVYQR